MCLQTEDWTREKGVATDDDWQDTMVTSWMLSISFLATGLDFYSDPGAIYNFKQPYTAWYCPQDIYYIHGLCSNSYPVLSSPYIDHYVVHLSRELDRFGTQPFVGLLITTQFIIRRRDCLVYIGRLYATSVVHYEIGYTLHYGTPSAR